MKEFFKRLHALNLKWAHSKPGICVLFIAAFADASFFTLPVLTFMIALTLLNTTNAYKNALIAVLGTLAGAIAGYSIGHFAWIKPDGEFTGVAKYLFDIIPGFTESGYTKGQQLYDNWGSGILFLSIVLPLPYKIYSISSGVFDMNLFIFIASTLVSQSIKFFLMAFLTLKLGPEVKKLLNIRWKPVIVILTASIAAAIILIKVF
jgi:membrane protein YqaA with SNARE-associated domain